VVVPFVALLGFIPVVLIIGMLTSFMAMTVVFVTLVVIGTRRTSGEECKRENPRNARHV
jgi:hypothetical protein